MPLGTSFLFLLRRTWQGKFSWVECSVIAKTSACLGLSEALCVVAMHVCACVLPRKYVLWVSSLAGSSQWQFGRVCFGPNEKLSADK